MFSNDHGDKFPWITRKLDGGTANDTSLAKEGSNPQNFRAISNELVSPKVLACNSDGTTVKISDWGVFALPSAAANSAGMDSVSYYLGMDADEGKPSTVLSGDRNLMTPNGTGTVGGSPTKIWNDAAPYNNINPTWDQTIHVKAGNIGLGDGSAQQVTDSTAKRQIIAALQAGSTQQEMQFPRP